MTDQQKGEILMYKSEDGLIKIEVELRGETVWLSLNRWRSFFSAKDKLYPDI